MLTTFGSEIIEICAKNLGNACSRSSFKKISQWLPYTGPNYAHTLTMVFCYNKPSHYMNKQTTAITTTRYLNKCL